MAQLIEWRSAQQAKQKLGKRLKGCKDYRKRMLEDQWRFNERVAYGGYEDLDAMQSQLAQLVDDTADFDLGESIEVNYAHKNLRFLHAQMSANPPVATPRPESADLEDRRAADACAQAMLWFLRALQLQEKVDLISLDALVYGTGIGRTGFNPHAGDILEFDDDTGELVLEGEVEFVRVSPWKFYFDPAAETWDTVRYTFEEITLSADEVRSQFPTKLAKFRKNKRTPDQIQTASVVSDRSTLSVDAATEKEEKYVFYAYFEPGLPENGMLGRFCYCFDDGELLTAPTINQNQHRPSPTLKQRKKYRETGRRPKRKPATAYLPYHLLTDIDVPGMVWGRSALQYAGPAQNLMRSLDSATLEAAKAHGLARLMVGPGTKMAEDAVSNSSLDIIRIDDLGEQGFDPKYLPPPGVSPVMSELRTNMRQGVDDMFGINESMFGQQSREQSGFAMQYAVNQGSMIRRRLFNKYVLFIESLYRALIRLAIQHWDDPKMIKVLGKENAFDIVEMRGIDIDGGYQIVTEYGTSLPLDPMSRRDELLKLVPIFKDAGVDPKVLIENLKLSDLKDAEDIPTLSRTRMKELIDTMIAQNVYIKPRPYQDHAGMLAYCREYIMTSEYFALTEQYKQLVEQHMTDRAAQAAAEEQGTSSLAANPSAGPAPGGPTGQMAAAPGGLPTQPVSVPPPTTSPATGMPAVPATPPVVAAS